MKASFTRSTFALLGIFAMSGHALAAGDLSQQEPIAVRVDLGRADTDQHGFFPGELTFETGKLYKLTIGNPSQHPHYFTSNEFTQKIFTRKVQVVEAADPSKRIAEIKGPVREIEVYPGYVVEWWFVPVATGRITDLQCGIKDKDGRTHAEKGMVGVISLR